MWWDSDIWRWMMKGCVKVAPRNKYNAGLNSSWGYIGAIQCYGADPGPTPSLRHLPVSGITIPGMLPRCLCGSAQLWQCGNLLDYRAGTESIVSGECGCTQCVVVRWRLL